ncbi:hypothetical protein D9619_010425 [Psilocybe cf. subviscida]|uniref:Uncharacterized protein n=1 Tax=Psilocybe cf. subviscida TaxID=2480587 RepID=A0A8H5AS61_9AGAR|nr:hypothetical protein D9619_010425 [Psilocybe cf. subviscida]
MVRALLLPLPLLFLLSSALPTVHTHATTASVSSTSSSLDPQIDPLADTQPPRYAIESDDEEDEVPSAIKQVASASGPQPFDIKLQGPFTQLTNKPLLIATGAAGRAYARGASLGEQAGAVGVSGVQMGLLFAPQNGALVLVSEALSSLPLPAMAPYAKEVLDALKPSSVALLDTYSLPSYASTEPPSTASSPIRYLASEGATKPPASSGLQPFSPPNLQLGTSAAFISLSAFSSSSSSAPKAVLVLLPSPHTPPSPPKTVPQADLSLLPQSGENSEAAEWSAETMNKAQDAMMAALGVKSEQKWEVRNSAKLGDGQAQAGAKRRAESQVGDGGMYI